MTWKKTLAGGAAGLAAIAVLAGFRGGCGGHHAHGRDPAEVAAFVTDRVDDALDDLDATPEQRQRIHAVKDRLLSEGMKLRGTRGETHREVLAQWDAAQPDAARLHALVDARIDEMRAIAHQGVDAAVEVHGVLTPEQRARVSRKMHRHAGEP
jgi:Spy/CpxP family protein refolding chaperone